MYFSHIYIHIYSRNIKTGGNFTFLPACKTNVVDKIKKKTHFVIDNVFHQLNALVIKTLKYSKTV
jgi:hypothetical protein